MREESGGSQTAFIFLLVLLAVIILYVLSVGPAGKLALHKGWPLEPFERLYLPLTWLYENTPLDGPIDWWLDLWGVY